MEAIIGAAHPFAALSGIREAASVQKPEVSPAVNPEKSVSIMDEYVPEEKHTPSGLYWIGRDEQGAPKVCFDDPRGKPAETCTTNTDKVDRELEKLRGREEKLEQRLGAETDAAKVQELWQKLAQVQAELAQKDNDSYRRQNAVIS